MPSARGEKKGARNSRSRKECECDRQVVVMQAVTREMEEAPGGGYLNKGCADGWCERALRQSKRSDASFSELL